MYFQAEMTREMGVIALQTRRKSQRQKQQIIASIPHNRITFDNLTRFRSGFLLQKAKNLKIMKI